MRHTDDMKREMTVASSPSYAISLTSTSRRMRMFHSLSGSLRDLAVVIGMDWDVQGYVANYGNHFLYRLRANKHLFTYHHAIPNDGLVISVVF